MLCQKHLPRTLALFGAVAFVVCSLWGYVIPAEVRELHANLLKISVLGWSGMNPVSFILGIVEWAVWGFIIGWGLTCCGRGSGCGDMSCKMEEKK